MSRNVLVTGATRGIGRAVAERMASLGHNLFLLGRDTAAMESVVSACRGRGVDVASRCGSLADEGWMAETVDAALQHYGHIDVLINNAGMARLESAQQADPAAWREVMAVNFDAAVFLCAKLLPRMIERESGTIINVSSISGRNTEPGAGVYAASKHALNGFGGCMYEDVRDHGIKVSTIMPGFVETELTSAMPLKAEHMIRAEDIADCVEFVLSASPHCCPTEIVLRPQKRP